MQLISMVLGILVLVGFLIGFLPCLGWFNWLNIPVAVVALIISLVAYSKAPPASDRRGAQIGIICSALAIGLGILRLSLGGGIF